MRIDCGSMYSHSSVGIGGGNWLEGISAAKTNCDVWSKKGSITEQSLLGIAHLPLIYFGFNYSSDNAGAPWSNMLMMMLVCVTMGIICSYVMVCSGNVMYSAIIHGVVNVVGEIPVFVSVSGKNGLLGPNPTGLISMSGLILCAIIMLIKLPTVKGANYGKDSF